MAANNRKLSEYQEIIRKIIQAFGEVRFYLVVESMLGVKVKPYSKDNPKDEELVGEIAFIADALTQIYNKNRIDEDLYSQIKGHRPTNFRPNEAAVLVEELFAPTYQFLKDQLHFIKEIEHWGEKGYPDTRITGKDGSVTYLEIKATTRPDQGSPRDFYFTPLKMAKMKITSDAHHFILGFIVKESSPKLFHTIGWKLADLYKMNVSMKPEFNCNNLEIYKPEAIIRENLLETGVGHGRQMPPLPF